MAKVHEPLLHIAKRDNISSGKVWAIRGIALLAALIFCGIITLFVTGLNPVKVYVTMAEEAFGTSRKAWVLLKDLAILLCVSLAVTPAFRMRFWNIGGEGQILIGALATASLMILFGGKIPNWLLIPACLLFALLAGAVWGAIPAFCKAKWQTNETLFTLMMNYVALQLVSYFIIIWEVPKGAGKIGIINAAGMEGWLPSIGNYKYLLNIIIVAVLTVLMYIYLNYTKHGYEISVVGESERTARYVGIKVPRVIVRTMALSGALCALAGFLRVAGTDHTLTTTITNGYGFTAVLVSWLAQFNPIAMVLTAFIIIFMARGAAGISTQFRLNESYADILTGIILFFIIGSEFFIRYRVIFRKSEKREG